jgi:beta-lactamase class A
LLARRELMTGLVLLLPSWRSSTAAPGSESPEATFTALERRSGGRLGVAVLDARSGKTFGHRARERFALCSTFKFVAAAAVLHRVDRGEDRLSRFIRYTEADLLEHAPVTRARVSEGGMPLGDLCAAAVGVSDNTAGNLILAASGGPKGLTRYCRSLGDAVTRLDRTEPTLNLVGPGEVRDTTTPAAMLGLMRAILLGKALSETSRRQVETWLVEAKIGADRIPAGLPAGWRVGHKTGTGPRGETNDIAVAWPAEQGSPVLIASYYAGSDAPLAQRSSVLAEVGRVVAKYAGPKER